MSPSRVVTVVCTGNLCRSPMGEVFLREHLRALSVVGVEVRSAGTHAMPGHPAMPEAVAAVAAVRGDLRAHRTRVLDDDVVRDSHLLLCAAREHQEWILTLWPGVEPARVRLFHDASPGADGRDVEDPFGAHVSVYHLASAVIDRAMEAWARRLAAGDWPT